MVDKLGNTPLHVACQKDKPKAVDWLLRNGAHCSDHNEANMAPIHVAVDHGNHKSLKVSP